LKISILIKAFNEEATIVRAIESCLSELQDIEGEVILADSCSTDRTVALASKYPIRIVQFMDPEDRGCGAGAQLAYQHAVGEYVYLLDGDMALRAGFISRAVRYLDGNLDVTGVGGLVNEVLSPNGNMEMENRRRRESHLYRSGSVKALDCGGLYRRSSLIKLGYFADRNLHSYEELDLGARIRSTGGKLHRLDIVGVDHFHRSIGSYKLLLKRVMSRYANGAGELLRASIGRKHFKFVVRELRILHVAVAIMLWVISTILVELETDATFATGVVFLPFLFMIFRRRSFRLGIYSVLSWFVYTAAIFRGLVAPRRSPFLPIESVVVYDRVEPVGRMSDNQMDNALA